MNNGLKNVKHSHESSVAMKCCQCKACCLSGILLDFKSIARIAFYHPTEQLFSKKAPTYAAADRRHAGSAKYKSRALRLARVQEKCRDIKDIYQGFCEDPAVKFP